MSIDDFKNKFMVISKKLGHHEPVRHVLNECWFASPVSWTQPVQYHVCCVRIFVAFLLS